MHGRRYQGWGQDFGRPVNPIQFKGADYAHHITASLPPPRISDLPTALICIELLYTNLLLVIAILKCLCDTTVCENERRNHSSKILAHFIHKMGSKELFRSIA